MILYVYFVCQCIVWRTGLHVVLHFNYLQKLFLWNTVFLYIFVSKMFTFLRGETFLRPLIFAFLFPNFLTF